MIGKVVAMEPVAYETWLAGGPREQSMTARGQFLFQNFSCNTCHRADGQGRGPALEGIFGKTITLQNGQKVVVDDNYLRESILTPASKVVAGYQPVMPIFQGLVNEEALAQLLAYIKSLAPQAATLPATTQASPAPESERQNSKP
jgi:cytochrome c oxidase subunit 2